ncbi:hypothetical protein D0T50_09875 [Bacteroides sp. 214]|uniref:hypothetical protein n=1 Tax=Bacteroides sp. 214 TaxID=2302935 RepID=UPI0013D8791E|nr:hypothetical protein [Bacteroides sp. 214]NDW13201.1 hypothetical protein [Bacteroides sp. 214]
MPINFFDEDAKTNSSSSIFGICDDPSPSTTPAYIDENKDNEDKKWIGVVHNSATQSIDFYPIDNCVPLLRPNGDKENRCDGVLSYSNNLIFVELKERGGSGWIGIGRNQLTITLQRFRENHNISDYTKIEAYICNKLRPISSKNHANEIQKFKDETGLILNVQRNIHI